MRPAAAGGRRRAVDVRTAERGYPPSIGTDALRAGDPALDATAASTSTSPLGQIGGVRRHEGVRRHAAAVAAACARPSRDTVLYPAVAYPTYEMGAILAGCRAGAGAARRRRAASTSTAIDPDDAGAGAVLWVNSPRNPTGALDDLGAAAAWGRAHGVPVFSDECYVEFTWDGPARTHPRARARRRGRRALAVEALEPRRRAGRLLRRRRRARRLPQEVRKHVGMMVPGPAQAAGVGRARRRRARRACSATATAAASSGSARCSSAWSGIDVPLPAGGFYLWFDAGDGWEFAERLAREGGALVSPGDFYGAGGAQNVRVAVVQPDDRIELVARRLGVS